MSECPDLELNKSQAAAALTPPARQVHRGVLTTFTATGRAPLRADLDDHARDHSIDLVPALIELTTSDVLALDERGEIRAAYPFSPVPTAHVITWAGGPAVYAMCAIDALGVSAMLGRPVTITSTEPRTGATIIVEVDHDRACWIPGTAVVLDGRTDNACCPSVDRTCGHINFFTDIRTADRWMGAHPHVTAVALTREQAVARGVAEFATLMRPSSAST
jgi:hypothetical protein